MLLCSSFLLSPCISVSVKGKGEWGDLRSRGKLGEAPESGETGCIMSLWQENHCVRRFLHPHGCFICSQANFLFLISLAAAVQAELLVGLLSKASSGPLRLSIFLHLWLLFNIRPWVSLLRLRLLSFLVDSFFLSTLSMFKSTS